MWEAKKTHKKLEGDEKILADFPFDFNWTASRKFLEILFAGNEKVDELHEQFFSK